MNKLDSFFSEFKNLPDKRKTIIAAIVVLAMMLGVGIPQFIQFFSKSSQQNTASIQLTLNKSTIKTGESTIATLLLDSSKTGVEVADFYIHFDPDAITIQNIQTGTFFRTYPIKEIGKDTLRIAAVATVTEKSIIVPKGKGTIATFTVTGKNRQRTIVSIDSHKTKIATDGKNIADFSKGTEVTIDIQ